MLKPLSIVADMKTFVFLVCHKDGTADFADIVSESVASAVRQLVAQSAATDRFNVVSITP